MKTIIGRAINGIGLNGNEWLLDENDKAKEFDNKVAAKAFLLTHGYENWSDDDLEDTFTFKEQ